MPCHTNLLHINQNLCHSISPLLLGSVENQYMSSSLTYNSLFCSLFKSKKKDARV